MLSYADHAVVEQAKICDYLLHHGRTGMVRHIESDTYGVKVVISASLKGPNGTSRQFSTVWLIPDSSIQPRLITAFPE